MSQRPDYRLILFDIDGTLLRTNGAGRRATAAAMLEVFGTSSTIDQHQFGGKTDYFTLTELLAAHGFDATAIGARLDAFSRAMGRHTELILKSEAAYALPGALDVVNHLRTMPDKIIGLVTGNAPSSAHAKLRAAGFDPAWFPIGAFGTESVDRDVLPALAIERAITHCDCSIDPQQVVVIGDTLMDIACARAAGAVAVAVLTGFEDKARLYNAKPDYVLDDLTQLLDIL